MRAAVLHRGDVAWRCGRALATTYSPSRAAVSSSSSNGVPLARCLAGSKPYMLYTARQSTAAAAAAAAAGTTATTAGMSTSAGPTDRPRVCIVGGGFGGLYTAIKLELLMWPKGKKPQITLVDQGERFIFKPLLYELLNGTAQSWEVAPTFAQLLAPYPIQFVQDKVLTVQPEQHLSDGGSATGGVVQLASGTSLPYDWLVVALGAAADPRGVPGIRENARPFNSLADAEFVAGRLAAFEARAALGQQQQATIVIVGAGYAGVELSAVVGERMRGKAAVVLVTPGGSILESAPAGQRQAAEEALRNLGVTLMTDTKVSGVRRADTEAPASASSADTAATEAAMAAAATAAAAAAAESIAGLEAVPPRPQSPEAAAVEPLAVLAAAAAAAAPEAPGSSNGSAADVASTSYTNSNGTVDGSAAERSSTDPVSTSTGEDASYIVQLEPVWGPTGSEASSSSSSSMPADLVLWTAGARPASTPLEPFPLDARGQLEVDPTLRVLRHSRVFALGDVSRNQPGNDGSSSSSAGFYPATAQVAFQQADYAAWNVWSAINGRPLLPFRYQHLGDMMSLGTSNAAVAFPIQLPSEVAASISSSPLGSALTLAGIKVGPGAEGLVLEGPLAQLLRRAAYLYRQPTNEQRLSVAASWIEQAMTMAARLAAELSANNAGRDGGRTQS